MNTAKTNPVTHSIPHDLDPKTASAVGRKAINGFIAKHKQIKGRWTSPTCCELVVVAGFSRLTGSVRIHCEEIVFAIDHVPSIFTGFVTKAVNAIDTATKEAIRKAKRAARHKAYEDDIDKHYQGKA